MQNKTEQKTEQDEYSVSLCMIVKDEEDTLARCLQSVQGHVDEIIVVDTGSTDRTIEIAEKMGAQVYRMKWNQDFSEARNFAKSKATKKWILQMDADEYFDEQQAALVKKEIKRTRKDSLLVRIINVLDDHQPSVSHVFPRVYKNLPDICYKYKIHEQTMRGSDDLDPDESTIKFFHTGYTKEKIQQKNKHQRNLKILKEELKKDRKNGFTYLNISNEWTALHQYEKALEYAKKAYELGENRSFRPKAAFNVAQSLVQLKRFTEAIHVLQGAKEAYQGYTDILFLEGLIYQDMGRLQDAKTCFWSCLQAGEAKLHYQSKRGVGSLLPMKQMLSIAMEERSFSHALQWINQILMIDPYDELSARSKAKIMRQNKLDISTFLGDMYSKNQKGLLFALQVAHSVRDGEVALHYLHQLQNIKQNIKQNINMNTLDLETRFYISLYQNDKQRAKQILSLFDKNEEKAQLFTMLFLLFYGRKRITKDMRAYVESNETVEFLMLDHEKDHENAKEKRIDVATGDRANNEDQTRETAIKKEYNRNLYLALLQELISFKKFELFDEMLKKSTCFGPSINKDLGDLFYNNYKDTLAIQYYTKHVMSDGTDWRTFIRIAELLLSQGKNKEALLFANQSLIQQEQALKRKKTNEKTMLFGRAIEIAIACHELAGDEQALLSFCAQSLTVMPDSAYVLSKLEKNIF